MTMTMTTTTTSSTATTTMTNDDDDDDDSSSDESGEAPAHMLHQQQAPGSDRSSRSKGGVDLDAGRRSGTIRVLTFTAANLIAGVMTCASGGDNWAPKRFNDIDNIDSPQLQEEWLPAHYKENDGLFDTGT
eukprot:6983956-Prymnesium_polylepis.1